MNIKGDTIDNKELLEKMKTASEADDVRFKADRVFMPKGKYSCGFGDASTK